MNTKPFEPEIIQGEVVEPTPATSPTPTANAPGQFPFVMQPQDISPLISLAVGLAIYEGIRWALWRYYDHLADS